MDKTKNAVEIFNKCANLYQDKFMKVDLYADTLDLFCKSIVEEYAEILELACGPGNITKYVLKTRPDFKILGIDLASNMIELAKINNPDAVFQLMDCRDIGNLNKIYDGIIGGFCLPYLSRDESVKIIRDASGLLKTNGILYLSTMEDDYSKSGIEKGSTGDEIYIYYHQEDYLIDALIDCNFKIIDLQRKIYLSEAGKRTIDLVILARKAN